MRALLVVNPAASTTLTDTRDVLASALASEVKVELVATTHRGHAQELAAQAVTDGLELVVALGGDGTINEVVQGLLSQGPHAGQPALAVVPGGCANVFARSLGLPTDPVAATGRVLDALRTGRRRRIGLGRLDERYFTFAAGFGWDAAAIRRVERQRAAGHAATPGRYLRAAVHEYLRGVDRRTPELVLTDASGLSTPVHLAVVCNTTPWTYLGRRAAQPCPQAGFSTGLDLFALRHLHTLPLLVELARVFSPDGHGGRGRNVVHLHDQPHLQLRAEHPLPVQTDGDYLGERTTVTLRAVPRALTVLC